MEETRVPALFTKEGLEIRKSMASTYAGSSVVPEIYQKNPANCFIAVNMAERMGADPMMVMQQMYIVYGRPSWSSQFLIATFNNSGKFSPIRYEFFGKPGTDDYGCRAYATEIATGERVQSIDVTIKMAKDEGWYEKKGSKWKTMPQLMLQYRSAAFLIRTVAPEISMGLQTAEEVADTINVTPDENGMYVSSEEVAEKVEKETEEAMANMTEPEPAEAPAEKARPF